MASKGQPERQPNDTQAWKPPRGIRFSLKNGRPAPFFLHWRGDDGIRKSQAYGNAADREVAAKSLAEKRRKHGTAVLSIDPVRWARYLEFQTIVGLDTDPLTVGREWVASKNGAAAGLTVAEAVKTYLERRRIDEPNLSRDTWRHFDKHFGRFTGTFGAFRLNEVTAEHIRTWLASLPFESLTKRHHRKDVNTFFKRAVREGWVQRNPCELVAVPFSAVEDVSVISPANAKRYFKANAGQRVLYRIALEAFGGLRSSSAGRIELSDILFAERGVAMPGHKHKSGKRKFRQGHPDVLWRWLRAAPAACWAMTPTQYKHEKRAASIRAGFDVPKNVWRKSFASYLLAMTKNMPLVAYLMQHTRASTTEIYEGIATEAAAKEYFGIGPARKPSGASPNIT